MRTHPSPLPWVAEVMAIDAETVTIKMHARQYVDGEVHKLPRQMVSFETRIKDPPSFERPPTPAPEDNPWLQAVAHEAGVALPLAKPEDEPNIISITRPVGMSGPPKDKPPEGDCWSQLAKRNKEDK